MDEYAMTDVYNMSPAITFLIGFMGGFVFGYGYFSALRKTTQLIVDHGQPLLGLGLTVGRATLLAGGLYFAVQIGALALLAALAGILSAKALMLRLVQREST